MQSLGTDCLVTQVIQVGGNVLCSAGPHLPNSVWNKEELPQPWKQFILSYLFSMMGNDCNNY
jgi:hypothetical protein